ncbi:hypothetical protein N431DRAFT_431227 [Stipitochalara longipes BDJ]|nr:hypothetical protein N431DRAFT_431227 [Stipitochalara longipes BDJ]
MPWHHIPCYIVDRRVDVKNEKDKSNWELYEPGKHVDAPVGLQIVTRRFEDEKCLAVLELWRRLWSARGKALKVDGSGERWSRNADARLEVPSHIL